jgi:hypothetical protein
MKPLAIITAVSCLCVLIGCERKPPTPPGGGPGGSPPPAAPGAAREHSAGHGGEVVELGTATLGALTVRASRDKGDIKPGGDAPIDVWLTTTADGKPATVRAMRFWIGLEDAKGSVKAKAEVEDPKEAHHWHTHAEVPAPLPDGAKLWVEVESTEGKKEVVAFDL